MRRARLGEQGLTIIEVMSAIVVFTLITLGITPLIMSSVRGSAVSRTFVAGKNLAVEAMERARGLPYFVDFPTQTALPNMSPPRKIDLLDLYFPNLTANGSFGYRAADATYTIFCTSASTDPACPRSMPADYTLTFIARFVRPALNIATNEETYQTVVPPSGYQWNPSSYANQDVPPSRLLELRVIASWTYLGRARRFELKSILGERDLGEVALSGYGRVDAAIKVGTIYTRRFFDDDNDNRRVELKAIGGTVESLIESKTTTTADQTVRGGTLRLLDVPNTSGTGDVSGRELARVEGVVAAFHAPPDSTPSDRDGAAVTLVHPKLGPVAGLDGTRARDLRVAVSAELPTASGTLEFLAPAGSERLFWASGQPLDEGDEDQNRLQLLGGGTVQFLPYLGRTLTAATSAVTTAVNSTGRRVETTASMAFGRLRVLPTNFISNISMLPDSPIRDDNAVVVVQDFTASVTCKATASTTTNPASASRSYSATVYFFQDDDPRDDIPRGRYVPISLSSANGSDPLAAYGPNASNPLVYDALDDRDDVYLFRTGDNLGYLSSWRSLIGSPPSVTEGGRVARASIVDALQIVTGPTASDRDSSALNIAVGNLGCEAVDRR